MERTYKREFHHRLGLRVLLYREDGHTVAHCLEMDLKGRGDTEDTAIAALTDLVEAQIAFAIFKDKPGLIYQPADNRLFDKFQALEEKALKAFPKKPRRGKLNFAHIPFPAPSDFEFTA